MMPAFAAKTLIDRRCLRRIGAPAAAAVLWLLLSGSVQAESEAVVFRSTTTPPIWSPQLPLDGMGGEILQLISAAAGVRYSIEYLPVARFRQSVAEYIVGDPDILVGKRDRAILPIALFSSALFVYLPNRAPPPQPTLKAMNGTTLGVLRGTVEDKDYFLRHGIKVEESDSIESMLRKLKKGRIDLCILVHLAGRYAIDRLFPDDKSRFVQVELPGTVRPIAIMIEVDAPEGKTMAKLYRSAMDKVLGSPEYFGILAKYYGEDGVPKDWLAQLEKFRHEYERDSKF